MMNMNEKKIPLAAKALAYKKQHQEAVGQWQEGDITGVWEDPESACICVRYESGRWWHYRQNKAGQTEWW